MKSFPYQPFEVTYNRGTEIPLIDANIQHSSVFHKIGGDTQSRKDPSLTILQHYISEGWNLPIHPKLSEGKRNLKWNSTLSMAYSLLICSTGINWIFSLLRHLLIPDSKETYHLQHCRNLPSLSGSMVDPSYWDLTRSLLQFQEFLNL